MCFVSICFIDRLIVHINTIFKKTYPTLPHTVDYNKISQYLSKMSINKLNTQYNYCYICVSRISLYQAHIELNNGIVDVAILFIHSLCYLLKYNDAFTLEMNNYKKINQQINVFILKFHYMLVH